jgi:hypothetical protein
MLGRRSKNSAAAIRATTTHARLEALELTLLAVLPLLPRRAARLSETISLGSWMKTSPLRQHRLCQRGTPNYFVTR